LAIDVLSAVVPLQLLRPLSGVHSGAYVPNKEIITDIPIQVYTTLLPAAIYGVVLVSAFGAFLPKYLVLYFGGIPTLRPAYEAGYVSLVPVTVLLGYAARNFIFTPFAAAADPTADDTKLEEFDPATATLQQTFYHNVWGYSTKSKVVILRTGALVLTTGIDTYLHCALTITGVESYGAIVYASVWATAALLTGMALGIVGSV
jgi:hypothetical protein